MKKKVILMLDLDGVFMGFAGFHTRSVKDFTKSIQVLDNWSKKGRDILIATNRTPSEMQPIAYTLGLTNGYWITENGGSIYNVSNGNVEYPKEMKKYALAYVPTLRTHIQQQSPSVVIHHSSGPIRTIFSSPTNIAQEQFIKIKILPIFEKYAHRGYFEIRSSKVTSIEPKNLSKKTALPLFFQLNRINPKKDQLFFVTDSDRDIELAKELSQYNATLGAVGNSTQRYLDFVKQYSQGVCAPLSTSHHSSLIYLLRAFDDLIEK
jgi:hydroxymethylpyrimidine pyrophosphatase-like HAD family hydrolase